MCSCIYVKQHLCILECNIMKNIIQNGTYNRQNVKKFHTFWILEVLIIYKTTAANIQGGVQKPQEHPKNSWGTPILQTLFIHHTILRLRLQLCTKLVLPIGNLLEFISAHQQVLQPFSAHKVYVNWYNFMKISEKWPRVHVGNYPTLIIYDCKFRFVLVWFGVSIK